MNAMVTKLVGVIIGIVVIFYLVGNLAPTLSTAAGNISGSGLPFLLKKTSSIKVCSRPFW
jgi:hypothetical protein